MHSTLIHLGVGISVPKFVNGCNYIYLIHKPIQVCICKTLDSTIKEPILIARFIKSALEKKMGENAFTFNSITVRIFFKFFSQFHVYYSFPCLKEN
jgi:hypothetical protein